MPDEQKILSAEEKSTVSSGRLESAFVDAKTVANNSSHSKDAADENDSVEVPAKFKSLIEEIEKMSVLDLAELVKILEDKFNVSAAAPAAAATVSAPATAVKQDKTEEKTSFDVELIEPGSNKIAIIKAVREITQQGLKESKDMVDGVPKIIKEGVAKAEAEEIKNKLEEAGAKVALK